MTDRGPIALVRSPAYSQAHETLVSTALGLAKRDGQLPTIAVLARATGMTRTTACYYFGSHDALLAAVKNWAFDRLGDTLGSPAPLPGRLAALVGFALDQPFAVKTLVEDWTNRASSETASHWTTLLGTMHGGAHPSDADQDVDTEVHLAWILGGALNGPNLLRNCSHPRQSRKQIHDRFRAERGRLALLVASLD